MKQIYTTATFELPTWIKVALSLTILICLAGAGLTLYNIMESPVFLVATLAFLLVSASMYCYIRSKLDISDAGLDFFNGLKTRHVDWKAITAVDLQLVGKYSDPQVIIQYNNTKLTLATSFYGKKQMKQMLDLLEMKVAPPLFSSSYQQLRAERLPSSAVTKY